MFSIEFNITSAHAASIVAKAYKVKDGTISGTLTPLANPSLFPARATVFAIDGLLESEGVQYFVLHGVQEKQGYRYRFLLHANKEKKVGVVEVSATTETHTQLLAVGTPTAKLLTPPRSKKGALKQSFSTAHLRHAAQSGNFMTTWWDPIDIAVNWVQDTISFNYNGSVVTSYSGSDNRWWLSETGWFEASHRIGDSYGPGKSSATVWTESHMQNNTFCLGQTTNVYYQDNAVYGYGDGTISGETNTWDDGGCADWLHYTAALS